MRLTIGIFLCCLYGIGFGLPLTGIHAPLTPLEQFKQAYKQKRYQEVIQKGQAYLEVQPDDFDIALYVGLAYYQTKQYQKAKAAFINVLSHYPDYLDARLVLITIYLIEKDYQQANMLIDKGLAISPQSIDLLLAKVKWLASQKRYEQAAKLLAKIRAMAPNNEAAKRMQLKVQNALAEIRRPKQPIKPGIARETPLPLSERPHYVIGGNVSNLDVAVSRDLTSSNEYWNYSSIFLQARNQPLDFRISMNYAKRTPGDGEELFLTVLPSFTDNTYVQVKAALGHNPNIFPNFTIGAELYHNFKKDLVLSAGGIHRQITSAIYFDTYDANITKYIGPFYINFNPIYYKPNAGPTSSLYQWRFRWYPSDADNYIGILLAAGSSPDLFDLLTVDFFKVKDTIIITEAQYALKPFLLLNAGGGFQQQRFLNNVIRNLYYLNIGIQYRVGYV